VSGAPWRRAGFGHVERPQADILTSRAAPRDLLWIAVTAFVAAVAGVIAADGNGPVLVLAVSAVLLGCAVATRPEVGLVVGLTLLPVGVYVAAFGGFSLFVWLPFLVIAAVGVLLQSPPVAVGASDLPVAPFMMLVGVGVLSGLASSDPITAATRIVYVAAFGLVAVAITRLLLVRPANHQRLVRAVITSAVIAAAIVCAQFAWALAVGPDAALEGLRGLYSLFGGERAAANSVANWFVPGIGVVRGILPFMAPPSAGQYLMIGFIVAVGLAQHPASSRVVRTPWIRWSIVAIIGLGLLATLSRQAWFGAAIGLLVLARRGSLSKIMPVALLATAVFFLVDVPGTDQSLAHHLIDAGNISEESGAGRVDLWQDSLGRIAEHPIIGVGPGLYGSLNSGGPDAGAYYAHNVFLDSFVELGVLGGIAFLWLFGSLVRRAARNSPTLALPALAAYLAAGLVDDVTYFPRNGFLLAVVAALACVPALTGDGRTGAPDEVPRRLSAAGARRPDS